MFTYSDPEAVAGGPPSRGALAEARGPGGGGGRGRLNS